VSRTGEQLLVTIDGRAVPVNLARVDSHLLSLIVDGRSIEIATAPASGGGLSISVDATPVVASVDSGRRWRRKDDHGGAGGPQRITAPMPGKVVRVLVKPGDAVRARQPLVVVEAMKMENELRALRDGRVADVHAREGQSVDAGTLLIVVQS
jgi:biotin carboxyl carrier protein